jgi:flagellar export protein FliJ
MTKPFRFDSILQLRHRQRDSAAMAVDEVVRAVRILDDQLSDLQQEISALDGERKLALHGTIAVGQLMEIQRHQLILIGNVQYLNQQRGKLLQEKTRRDFALLKAQQALKSLEKLKEKRDGEEKFRDAKLAQGRLDEWANTRVIAQQPVTSSNKPNERFNG